jgi:hypothetical protein
LGEGGMRNGDAEHDAVKPAQRFDSHAE